MGKEPKEIQFCERITLLDAVFKITAEEMTQMKDSHVQSREFNLYVRLLTDTDEYQNKSLVSFHPASGKGFYSSCWNAFYYF